MVDQAPRRAARPRVRPGRGRQTPSRRRVCSRRSPIRRRGAYRAEQPGGLDRHDPRRARHPRPAAHRRRRRWSVLSPIIGNAPVRGMADACLKRDRRRGERRRASGGTTVPARDDGHSGRVAHSRHRHRRDRRGRGARRPAADDRRRHDRRRWLGPLWSSPVSDRSDAIKPTTRSRRAGAIEILPVAGIGELRPGDDLAALIADNAPALCRR